MAHNAAIRSLYNRNFLIYLLGQSVSQVGNWFEQTAELWLIFVITGSATAVGFATTLRFGPLLLFGVQSGLLVDRLDRWKLLLTTQGVYMIATGVLAVAAFAATPNLFVVYAMILVQGVVAAVDNPLRRSFVRDLVTDDDLANAVGLNSTMHTMARAIGPAIAGILIVGVGVAWCFALNSISYGAVLISMLFINRKKFRPTHKVAAAPGQLREGFRYAWANRRIRRSLILATVLGLSTLNWNVILPMYAKDTFGGGADLYGGLVGVLGIGAFVGAVIVARVDRISGAYFRISGAVMAVSFVVVAAAPVLPIAIVGLAVVGAAATAIQILAQARLQLEADDAMSGRILALYSVGLVGTRPIGALLVGWLNDNSGPRFVFGGFAVIVAIVVVWLQTGRAPKPASAESEPESPALSTGPVAGQTPPT